MWSRMTGRPNPGSQGAASSSTGGPQGPGPGGTQAAAAPGQASSRTGTMAPAKGPGPGKNALAPTLSQGQGQSNEPPPVPPHREQPAPDTSEIIYNEPEQPANQENNEDILKKFAELDVRDQQILLEKMKKNTAQALYPTVDIEEMQDEAELKISDNEESANRIHRSLEISEAKLRELENLETVYKLKVKEKEKQRDQVKQLGETRELASKLVKARDTLERIRDGRISDPSDIESRIGSLGEFRVDYAMIKKPKTKKRKIVKLVEPINNDDTDTEAEEFFDSQESFASESAAVDNKVMRKVKKKQKRDQTHSSKQKVTQAAKPKTKSREEPPSDPSSTSSSSSSDSSSSDEEGDDEEEEDQEEENDEEEEDELEFGQSLVQLANGKMNKKIQRRLLLVQRILSRAKENESEEDKGTVEKVKTELASAMNLLDKTAVDEKDGTAAQWEEVEKSFKLVSKAQKINLRNLKNLEDDVQRRNQLPKASLDTWDGDPAKLQSWLLHLKQTLKFSDDLLNVATLKKSVAEGREKKRILRRLQYCTTLEECFSKLQKFYGSFEIALPEMKKRIEALPNEPDDEDQESHNIEQLLYFISQMRAHKREKKIVNQLFINEFLHKLSTSRAKEVTDAKIKSCKKFEKYLEDVLESNLQYSSTKPKGERKSKPPRNVQHNQTDLGVGEEESKQKKGCPFCGKSHFLEKCPKMEGKSTRVRKQMVLGVKRCLQCFQKYDSSHICPLKQSKWVCEDHRCNISLCGCTLRETSWPEAQNNCNQVTAEKSPSSINGLFLGCVGFLLKL